MNFHAKELRRGRVSQADAIYSITAVTYERQTIFDDFGSARLLIQTLRQSQLEKQSETIGFVLMPDHLHWMVRLHHSIKLSRLMMIIKGRSARQINLYRNNKQPIWQKGYYDHCVRDDEDLIKNMRYIVANPLRAGLVSTLRHYPHWDSVFL